MHEIVSNGTLACESLIPTLTRLDVTRNDLKQYQDDLQKAAVEDSDALFSNSGPERAAILLSTIFKNTTTEIYVYASFLRRDLTSYDLYFNELKGMLERNIDVNILLDEEQECSKSPVRKWLEEASGSYSNLTLRSASNSSLIFEKYMKNATHFTVADGKMFRLEYDRDNFKAFGSLNSPRVSSYLQQTFINVVNDRQLV